MALGAVSAVPVLTCEIVRVTRTLAYRALVAQWIERSPAKAEAVGSNPAKRATCCERRQCQAHGCGMHIWAVSSVG